MPEHRSARQTSTLVMSVIMVVIGVALIVRTLTAGGKPLATGVILGVLFVAVGAGRIYLGRLTR